MAKSDEEAAKRSAKLESQLAAMMQVLTHLNTKGDDTVCLMPTDTTALPVANDKHSKKLVGGKINDSKTDKSEHSMSSSEDSAEEKQSKRKVNLSLLGRINIQSILLSANLNGGSLYARLYMGKNLTGRTSLLFSHKILPELNAHSKSGKKQSKSSWPFK
ncbi:hypothetical protein JCM1841_004222 [Sporobolomyces salmonicolor]